jgi:Fe-S-cluster-containing dehydrogenase component
MTATQERSNMSKRLSRRSFIKAGLATAGAVAAAGVPAARAGADPDRELCTLLDIRKCIACESCVEACREVNAEKFPEPEGPMPVMQPVSRVKVADWSSEAKREVSDRLTPYNWIFIQEAVGQYQGEDFELSIPRRCMHCRNAPCTNLCPFGAAYSQPNGIVRIHPDICMGGAKCKKVCPWHIPERQSGVGLHLELLPQYAGNGVMYKCDRCYSRVAAGELPACVEACPEDVQQIGPRNEIVREAHRLAKEIDGFIYGEIENGGTNTIYVSPVPFDVLAAAIEKGPGRPHLGPVADSMADTNRMAAALAIGPIAGVLGALGRFMSLGKSSPGEQEVDHDA